MSVVEFNFKRLFRHQIDMKKSIKTIGSWITLGNEGIVEIMSCVGFDWLCIDLEHSVIDYQLAQNLIITIQSKGLKAYVRIGENSSLIIKRVLDAGADGIIIPSINSAEEARKAVNSVKYPPTGMRGVGLARAQGYGFDFDEYRDKKSKEIIVIAQIEHFEAVNEIDKILEVEGLDGTFIGPYDLSGSLGKPGKFEDKEFISLLQRYEEATRKYDKINGYHVVPIDHILIQEKFNLGYNFIAYSFDGYFLGKKLRDEMDKIKKI